MKIFFLNPPFRDQHFSRSQRSPGVIKSGTMYYPYWLAHAAALCEANGHSIFLLDAPADGKSREEVFAALREFTPDLIVCETSTPSHNHDLETITLLRDEVPGAHTCMVGTQVTSEWEKALQACKELDFAGIGEYDFTVLDLANSLSSADSDPRTIAGLAFRNHGNIERGPARLPIPNVDVLPWIAPIYQRFLTPEHYRFTIATHPMVMLIGGRGCPARCFYCVYPQVMHGHQYRVRSAEHLVGEMKWIQDNMPEINEIVFEDDTFTADPKRAREISAAITTNGVQLPFFANIRTNIDYETLAALKQSGLRECATGFESGDKTLLMNMRKGQTVEQQFQLMKNCRDLGILVHGCFMVGFPGETGGTMQKTLDLALRLDPDSAQFYPVMPYPGTGAYQWAQDNDLLATQQFDEWLTEEGGHRCVLNLPGLTPDQIEKFCERAFVRFHFRPKYMLRKLRQAIAQPREGLRSVGAALKFLVYLFTNQRKKQASFSVSTKEVTDAWLGRKRVARGRMEAMSDVVRKSESQDPCVDADLNQQIVAAELATQR